MTTKANLNETVIALDLGLGDVVRLQSHSYDRICEPFDHAMVKRKHRDGRVTLFRPYVPEPGFAYGGPEDSSQVICYLGFEEFTVAANTIVERIRKGNPMLR